jgi:hypothetical protein
MSPADRLLSKLDGVQGKGPRYRAICPSHPSKNKSRTLAIFDAADGRVLLKCYAGCDVESITRAVGLELSDLFPPRVVDDQRAPRVRKPWSERDAVRALGHELHVAWVLLQDMAAGRPIAKSDRARAKTCADRCAALIQEMRA